MAEMPDLIVNESPVIMWTDIYSSDGEKWNLTLRYPVNHEMIAHMIEELPEIVESIKGAGFTMSRVTGPSAVAAPSVEIDGLPEWVTIHSIPQEGETTGYRLCNRVEVKGSRVEFYTPNDRLEYPVLNVPDFQVQEALGYEGDLSKLGWDKYQWVIQWKLSDKLNSKGNPYKDLIGLWKLEDYIELQKW